MAIMQLTMIPMGEGVSVGKYVADIQERLLDTGAVFKLVDMGTLIEGDIHQLLEIVSKIYEAPFENGAVRVVTHITIDDRRDKPVKIGGKVASVEKRLK